MMTHVAQQRGIAASVALSVLNGELSVLEGRERSVGSDGLDLDRSEDPDLSVIVLVDDETEALPIGEQRALLGSRSHSGEGAGAGSRRTVGPPSRA